MAPSRRSVALAVTAAAALLAACSPGADRGDFTAAPVTVQQSSARSAVPADLASPPKPGTVEIIENTFTDVVRIDHLQLRQVKRPVITGSLHSTVDVAPTLRLDLEALFYDSRGRYLGRATFTEEGHGEDQEEHAHTANEPTELTLRPRSPLGRPATSATLRIVQFITE